MTKHLKSSKREKETLPPKLDGGIPTPLLETLHTRDPLVTTGLATDFLNIQSQSQQKTSLDFEILKNRASDSTQQAVCETLSAGLSIVYSDSKFVIEKFPDGSKKILKAASPKVDLKQIMLLKKATLPKEDLAEVILKIENEQ